VIRKVKKKKVPEAFAVQLVEKHRWCWWMYQSSLD